jgi:hypothetical protein
VSGDSVFASFFIAEIIISGALIASVVIGYRVEIAKELAVSTPPAEPPSKGNPPGSDPSSSPP